MDDLLGLIEKTVRASLEASHALHGGEQPLPADPLVFDSGLLDSLGLAELVSAVEACTGCSVDMLRFDPLAVNTASDLVRELSRATYQPAQA
jgi:acyl carrier protein